jgi:hypothetical protein
MGGGLPANDSGRIGWLMISLLPNDIEQFLQSGQHGLAIDVLARRRAITIDEAREQLRIRLLEIVFETSDVPPGAA